MTGIVLLACSALLHGAVRADACGPAPGGPPGACADAVAGVAGGGPDAGAGNPINVITGNKYQREEDLPALPGVLGLEIVRHYNSAHTWPGAPNGPMGREWKLSYETALYDKYGRIQILQADGARVIFDRDPKHPGLCSTALPSNGRMALTRLANGMTQYTWTWPNGRRLHFNQWGKLTSIAAASGEMVTLQYDPGNVLVQVTDPQGRRLQLGYPGRETRKAGGRFLGVQTIDSPAGRFAYEYGSAVPAGAISGVKPFDARILWASLVRVRLPAGAAGEGGVSRTVSRLYHHEDPRFPWLITGISIETMGADGKASTARFATYGYDGNGLANLSTHAGNVGKVTLDTSIGGQTALTNSLGQRTFFHHAIVGGVQRLLEVRGAGCASCGETDVRYGYDKLGQLLETVKLTPDGAPVGATRRELDALGRTVRVDDIAYSDGKPGAARWRLRFEYPGDAPAPSVVARPSVVPGKERQTRIAYNLAGQPVEVTELGWAPAFGGAPATPLARTTRYGYAAINGRSLLVRIDGPLPNGPAASPLDSDVTVLEYDQRAADDSDRQSRPEKGALAPYDERRGRRDGVLSAVITPGNIRTALTYDAAGRVRAIAAIAGTLGHGDLADQLPPARAGRDAAGRIIWSASRLGMLSTWRYDTENRLIESATQSSAMRLARAYAYDTLGRPVAVTDAGGGRWRLVWNARGLPEALTDALGRVTRYRYDPQDRLVGVTPAVNMLEAGQDNETGFTLDVNGQVTAVTGPNGFVTRYVMDDFGQTIATVSADGGMTRRWFDAAGRLSASGDALGNEGRYEYDGAGRVVRQTIVDAGAKAGRRETVTAWRYDGQGRLAAVDHPEQAERYSYDARGRLAVKTVSVTLANGKQASHATRYCYDNEGQLAGVSLPDGSELAYRRNGQGQVVALERDIVHSPWLAALSGKTTIVKDLERDVAGLKHITYGNGIEALHQRGKEGALARIAYRNPAVAAPASVAVHDVKQAGALGLPSDPFALIDHRYLWDARGNLLHTGDKDASSGYAYDAFDRLIAAGTVARGNKGAAIFDRYYFDSAGNRLLAQQGVTSQDEIQGGTVRTGYAADSNRRQEAGGDVSEVRYDAAGQPRRTGRRAYTWDALGKLLEVSEDGKPLARYRYNHRGQRIAKDAGGKLTYYLYDDDRNLVAELDAGGKVRRQYVYLAGQAVALIDTPAGAASHEEQTAPLAQAMADIAALWRAWFGQGDTVVFLHNNHLGATELVTDARGKPVWRVNYAPFGKLRGGAKPGAFAFNPRLPGQYADEETGLYYNDHRYYDPEQGRYLTPDPLGLRGGGNGYAYADGNPLKYIDPSGLILFAFDGTGNSQKPPPEASISNVLKFYDAYDEAANGAKYYITGIGTTNEDMPFAGSGVTGEGFDQRVSLGIRFLNDYIKESTATAMVDIDVVGFSRGAAEARFFINVLVGQLKDGAYTVGGKSRCINLRFEGLWDTVPHLGLTHGDEYAYDFAIPPAVKYAVHAVALNEHRGSPLDFDARSIMDRPGQTSSATRIEKGFIGSHSDIGGAFGTGDLSDVALMWMISQAKGQGIAIKENILKDNGWNIVTTPILHDKSGNRMSSDAITLTRDVIYGNGASVLQTDAVIDGKKTSDTAGLISYFPNPYRCGTNANPDVGLVDMTKYNLWLASYGMTMATGPTVNSSCKP